MSRFLSEIQGKYTELVEIVKISISFNRLVFPVIFMKFNRFSHPMTLPNQRTADVIPLEATFCCFFSNNVNIANSV